MVRSALVVTSIVGFGSASVGCGGPEPRTELPVASAASLPTSAPPSSEAPASTTAATTTAAPALTVPAPAASATLASVVPPSTVRAASAECSAPRAALRLPSHDGTIFDNAMTEAESSRRDRARGVLAALRGVEHAMRCCFEPWVEASSDAESRALLRLALASDGQVRAVDFDASRGDLRDPAVISCLDGVLRTARFPRSPSGRETIVEYPIRARRGS
ncbi:MAG: hypothetical protein FJ096_00555 [Deltaproteobacteria bacterium]|nr:hypothetical protein [Deltaproteobacteria bacterium]